jgi:hypothetical protein
MPALATSYSEDVALCEYSLITGVGPYTLAGAMGGFLPLSERYANGATVAYWATDRSGKSELCSGTYSIAGPTLTRTLIVSTTGALIDWSGRTRVFIEPVLAELPLCATAPTLGQVLVWDGAEWCPASLGGPGGPVAPPVAAVCPTPPMDGQVLIWSAADNAYCPADVCTLVAACLAPPLDEATFTSGNLNIYNAEAELPQSAWTAFDYTDFGVTSSILTTGNISVSGFTAVIGAAGTVTVSSGGVANFDNGGLVGTFAANGNIYMRVGWNYNGTVISIGPTITAPYDTSQTVLIGTGIVGMSVSPGDVLYPVFYSTSDNPNTIGSIVSAEFDFQFG